MAIGGFRLKSGPDVIIEEVIMEDVEELLEDEILNGGQGNALVIKLEKALESIEDGEVKQATNKLNAFINQVNSFIDNGVLTEAEGQPLIDCANSAIEQLSE